MVALRSRRLETLFGVTLDALASEQIQSLVTNEVAEEFDLDFKRELYGNKDADRKALAGDVAALANTAGGVIILGVEENDQAVAVRADGVDLSDAEERRMRQIIASSTAPVPTFDIIKVPGEGVSSRGFYAIAVPRSIRAPHGVIVNDGYRFPKRNGSTTRYISESEIADAYRDRFNGTEQQTRRIEQVESEALARLDIGAHAWLTVTLVPELVGSMDVAHAAYKDFESSMLGSATNDILRGHGGSTFQRARVGRRRLIADCGRSNALATYASAEYHSDGAGAYSLRIGALSDGRRMMQGDDAAERQVLDDESIVIAVLTGVHRLAMHARDRAAAGGNAIIRARLSPKLGSTDIHIGYARGDGLAFGETWGSSSTEEAKSPAETVVDIDQVADAGPSLIAVASHLISELGQNFGFAEMAQLTPSGQIRRQYWIPQMLPLIEQWAQSNGIELIDETLG
ncbi:AlbA family DNA-binding domain-containing protein [Kribbella solani]|uniref:AlbA family DNA-binding domain-containing protein n=1 Tax=Kribbella solani TaxID=236067 RepID=UPI0029AB26B4|nr:ATP-binding protein [Kribbella solani]MDX2974573.1 ATP-binding protein [Kribbella solani]